VTFTRFRGLLWLFQNKIFRNPEESTELLSLLSGEVLQRYDRFQMAAVEDICQYNALEIKQRRYQDILPRIVVIADEFAQLATHPDYKEALDRALEILGEMARAAGIHLIFFTQRPSADVVIPRLRANLPRRIALKVADIHNSAIILGDKVGDAAHLLGKGDMLVGGQGNELIRLQALFAPDELINAFVQRHRQARDGEVRQRLPSNGSSYVNWMAIQPSCDFLNPTPAKGATTGVGQRGSTTSWHVCLMPR